MKLFSLTTSAALVGLAHSAPHYPSGALVQPYYSHPGVIPYHGVPICRTEIETIDLQTCVPHHEVKCKSSEDEFNTEVTYELQCQKVWDVICGAQAQTEQEQAEEEPTAAINTVLYASHPANLYHHCHKVEREQCYKVPVITEVPVKKCEVVKTAECRDSKMEVPKTVCEYEDGHVEESVEEGVEDSGEEGEEVAEEETEEEEAPAPVVDSDISNWFVKPSPQFYYPQYQQQQYAYYGK